MRTKLDFVQFVQFFNQCSWMEHYVIPSLVYQINLSSKEVGVCLCISGRPVFPLEANVKLF